MRRQGVGGVRPFWLASLDDDDTGIVANLNKTDALKFDLTQLQLIKSLTSKFMIIDIKI